MILQVEDDDEISNQALVLATENEGQRSKPQPQQDQPAASITTTEEHY
jgi:hypothetical protein